MKYLLKNIQITTATNSRGEYKWLRAELFNDADPFGNPAQLPFFHNMTNEVIKMYEAYAVDDPARPGVKVVNEVDLKNAINEGKCPDILHVSQIHAIRMPLPCTYARVYRTDVKNASTGAIEHKAGEYVVNQQGDITPINRIVLYLKKYLDSETGEYNWVDQPDTVLNRVLSRSYKKYGNDVETPISSAPSASAPSDSSEEKSVDDLKAELEAKLKALG